MEAAGCDSDGREFKNAQEMWREQIGDEGDDPGDMCAIDSYTPIGSSREDW